MEYREFTGKTVEDAVMEAAIKLETTSDKPGNAACRKKLN